jgi:hypothetical protein
MSVYRPIAPMSGVLPAATGVVVGFMRDPSKAPFLQYTQIVPAPLDGNGLFRYCTINPDDPARLVNLDEPAWGFDDPMPSGKGFVVQAKWDSAQTARYAFPYTLGDRTQAGWQKGAKVDVRQMYDRIRLGHAMLHRATRVVAAVRGNAWPAYNTSDLQNLRGTTGAGTAAYWDQSGGVQYTPSGNADPRFQIIKNTMNRVMRRLDLTTNGALTGEEFLCVFGPKVAQAVAESGEMVEYLKQSPYAEEKLTKRNKKWGIPDEYNGWKLVVEDTPRCYIRQKADGTVADVTVAGQKDYLWNDDAVFFGSRVGGLDGGYGFQNFSTVQLYTFDGPGSQASGLGESLRAGTYVKSEGDSWNEVQKGAVVVEDAPLVPAAISGFYLTGVLSQ